MKKVHADNYWKIILNFACVYIVWGSTYLAIKFAIEDIPPFFMASLRFTLAGFLLFFLGRLRGEKMLQAGDFKIAVLSGSLLVLANAFVCYSEKYIPSGLAAVIVGTMPVWVMVLNWQFFKGQKPRLRQFVGIVIAVTGIILLTGNQALNTSTTTYLAVGALIISLAAWSSGTLIQIRAKNRSSIFTFSSIQLGLGGIFLMISALLFEDLSQFDFVSVSAISWWSLAYLVLFGSVAAFSSYLWLNQNVDPTIVSTYALVNPVVAIWLGWIFAGEQVTMATLFNSLFVVAGLYLVIFKPKALK